MRKNVALSLACAVALLGGMVMAGSSVRAGDDSWLTSWSDAAKKAKDGKKPILMDFTGSDWCGWCIKLKKEVFDTPEFKKWAAEHVVLLEVDFPQRKELPAETKKQNEGLRDKYTVEGYPTIVFVDHEGKEIGRHGYEKGGPSVWIKSAEAVLKK